MGNNMPFFQQALESCGSAFEPTVKRLSKLSQSGSQVSKACHSCVVVVALTIALRAQRWSLGCPTANLPPGSMFVCGDALDSPRLGRLHFAGTETASSWPGYMEGAVEAGERAAEACLTAA